MLYLSYIILKNQFYIQLLQKKVIFLFMKKKILFSLIFYHYFIN